MKIYSITSILTLNFISALCITPHHNLHFKTYTDNSNEALQENNAEFNVFEKPNDMKMTKEDQVVYNVYPKEFTDSSEIDKNAPVEDFDDYSNEVNIVKSELPLEQIKEYNDIMDFIRQSANDVNIRKRRNVNETDKIITRKLYNIEKKTISERESKIQVKSQKSRQNAYIGKMKSKVKRNINRNNIIEEENIGTTITGFKFTGRSLHLNHELSYKNIHT